MKKGRVAVMLASAMLAMGVHAESITHGSTSIDMEFVSIGYAGNAADTSVMNDGTTGYGAVNYNYRIGQFEVTPV